MKPSQLQSIVRYNLNLVFFPTLNTFQSHLAMIDRSGVKVIESRRKQLASSQQVVETSATSSASSPSGPVVSAATSNKRRIVKGPKMVRTGSQHSQIRTCVSNIHVFHVDSSISQMGVTTLTKASRMKSFSPNLFIKT